MFTGIKLAEVLNKTLYILCRLAKSAQLKPSPLKTVQLDCFGLGLNDFVDL